MPSQSSAQSHQRARDEAVEGECGCACLCGREREKDSERGVGGGKGGNILVKDVLCSPPAAAFRLRFGAQRQNLLA